MAEEPIKGRGASKNPGNRFESQSYAPDPAPQSPNAIDDIDYTPDAEGGPRRHPLTQFLSDHSKTIIATNDSPDVPFTSSINPYRGCEHGCIYCFARPTHEYLGYSAGLDFETKILVKHDAPQLLRKQLASPKWQPQVIACSGVTDCYQPIERKLQLTRRCLEVLLDFRNPVGIVTKNHLVTRDIDLLAQLAAFQCARVFVSVTTLDPHLTQIMEPRTSTPARRLDAIRKLNDAGVSVGVMVAPVVPGLTDHEMPAILEAARDAGASSAGFVPLRLPWAVKDLFSDWLAAHFPDRKEKVLNRIRMLRGGKLYDATTHTRMTGEGLWAEQFKQMFTLSTTRLGLNQRSYRMSTDHFRRPVGEGEQFSLFGQ
jgi:DNA repair photolyase